MAHATHFPPASAEENKPAAHSERHTLEPAALVSPVGQGVHASELGVEYVLGGQISHGPLEHVPKVPAGHTLKHWSAPGGLQDPVPHATHDPTMEVQ